MQIISAGCNTGPLGSIFCGQVLQVFADILSNQGRLYMKLHPLKISLIRVFLSIIHHKAFKISQAKVHSSVLSSP